MKNKKILNAGCGGDTYGTHFIDVYPTRPNVLQCDLDNEKIPFRDNFFDEVYCSNVLEHLSNPGFVLKEFYRVLKTGGKLKLVTDNAHYWTWTFGKDHGEKYEVNKKSPKPNDRHLMLFEKTHLRNLLLRTGFKIIEIKFVSQKQNVAWKKPIEILSTFILRFILPKMAYRQIYVEAVK